MFQNSDAGDDLCPSQEKVCILVCRTSCLNLKTSAENWVSDNGSSCTDSPHPTIIYVCLNTSSPSLFDGERFILL